MTTQDFTTTILVNATPDQTFDAINNVRGWWSGELEGPTDTLGARFSYRYKDIHKSTHEITELVRGKRVVWKTVDAELSFVKDKKEWNGTEVVFEIALAPTGEVQSAKRIRSSGNAAWDDTVQRAILRSSPLPKPDNPAVFRSPLQFQFRPQERF